MEHSNELISLPNSIQAPQTIQTPTKSATSVPNASTTVKLEFPSVKGSKDPETKPGLTSALLAADLTLSVTDKDSPVILKKQSSKHRSAPKARHQKKYFLLDGELADTLTVCHRIQDVKNGGLDEALDMVDFEGIKYMPSYLPVEALKFEAVRTTLEMLPDRVTSPLQRQATYAIAYTGEVQGPKSIAANTEGPPQAQQLTNHTASQLLNTKCLVEHIGNGGEGNLLSPSDTIKRLMQAYIPSDSMTKENRKKVVQMDVHRRARYYLPSRKEMEKLFFLDDTAVRDQVIFIEDQVLPWARGCEKSTKLEKGNVYDLEIWFQCLADYEQQELPALWQEI